MPAFWLFKSEPDEFGIDALAASPRGQAPWDGIRNYQARNYLRDEVAEGDLVFIYHSACATPGVAGTAKVTSSPYPDPSQFDENSPYFDVKATADNPKWFAVDIKFTARFPRLVSAKELRKVPELTNMTLFRQGRLSVQPVSTVEWETIMAIASGK
jgi:predicted RNA-binding protein with PUA-like domain